MEKVEKLFKAMGTVSGADNVLEIIESSGKIVAISLTGKNPKHPAIPKIVALATLISNARMTFRLLGFPPAFAYLLSLPSQSYKTKVLKWLGILKMASITFYFPFEHAYLLGVSGVAPSLAPTAGRNGVISCRLWFAYLIFAILEAVYKIHHKIETKQAYNALYDEGLYVPRALHYSLVESPFHPIVEPIFALLSASNTLKNKLQ